VKFTVFLNKESTLKKKLTAEVVVLWVANCVVMFLFKSAVALVAAIPVLLLWNWLIPNILGMSAISFVQAWGLFLLASVLFKSNSAQKSKRMPSA